MRFLPAVLVLVATVLGPIDVSHAQTWPNRPVKFYVGSAAGSGPDVILRLVADRLSKRWGHPAVIENRPGAGGIPGTLAAAQAAPDGYSFLFGLGSALAMNQFLYKSLPFDPEKDFIPVVGVGVTPMVIAVNASSPVKSVAELIDYAKARPGAVPIGTTAKSAAHLTMQSFAQQSGTEYLHVFYKSAPDAFRDMIGGQVMVFSDALAAVPNLNDPRIRVLGVTAPQRLPNLPALPVVAETIPGFTSYGWYAIMAPAGTSKDVVRKLNEDVNAVLREPEIVARLRELATYDAGGTPEQLDKFIRSERDRLGKAARAAKIDPE